MARNAPNTPAVRPKATDARPNQKAARIASRFPDTSGEATAAAGRRPGSDVVTPPPTAGTATVKRLLQRLHLIRLPTSCSGAFTLWSQVGQVTEIDIGTSGNKKTRPALGGQLRTGVISPPLDVKKVDIFVPNGTTVTCPSKNTNKPPLLKGEPQEFCPPPPVWLSEITW